MDLVGWVAIVVAGVSLLSMIVDAARARSIKAGGISFLAVLALFGFGLLGYLVFGDFFIAVIMAVYGYTWVGTRWKEWLIQNRKFSRLVFWGLADVPFLALAGGSYLAWEKGWLTFIFSIVGSILYFILAQIVLKELFPVVSRQQQSILLRAGNQKNTEADQLDREVRQIESANHRKRMLKKLPRHQQMLNHAIQFRRSKQLQQAIPLVEEIIRDLAPVAVLEGGQKIVLGHAYQLRGKIQLAAKHFKEAANDFERARKYITLDDESVGGLALNAALQRDESEKGISYCLDFLQMRKDQPADERVKKVQEYLETICTVPDDMSIEQVRKKQPVLSTLVSVAPGMFAAQLALGQVFIRMNEWRQAAGPLEAACKLQPNNPAPHGFLGFANENLGKFNEARDSYKKSLELQPKQPVVAHALGVLSLDKLPRTDANLAEALNWLGVAAGLDMRQAVYAFDLARAYERKGDTVRAQVEVRRSLSIAPAYAPANLMLANMLYEQRSYHDAIPYYRKALESDQGRDSASRLKLGICLVEDRQMDDALKVLEPVEEKQPASKLYIGRAYLAGGSFKKARNKIRGYVDLVGDTEQAEFFLGCACAWDGLDDKDGNGYEDAIEAFERTLAYHGDYEARANLHLGKIYQVSGHPDKATGHYQACARNESASLDAGLGLVRIYLDQNQVAEARAILDFLKIRYSGDHRLFSLLGLVAETQNDLPEAERAYRQAGETGACAVVLFQLKREDEARTLLEQARKAGDATPRVLYYSGLAKYSSEDYEGAISEWELLKKDNPDDDRLTLNIARAWYKIGCKAFDRKEYEKALNAWEKYYPYATADQAFVSSLQQLNLLFAYENLGTPQAVHSLRRAQQLGADPHQCQYWEGISFLTGGDLNHGAAALEQYVKVEPVDATAQYNLGVAQLKQGRAAAAVSHFESAHSMAGAAIKEQAAWGLAAAAALNGDWKRVVEVVGGLNAARLKPWQAFLITLALAQTGQVDRATAVAGERRSAEAHLVLANHWAAQGKLDPALNEYRQALQTDGRNETAKEGAVSILMAQAAEFAGDEKWAEAQSCLAEAVKILPGSPSLLQLKEIIDSAAVLAGVRLDNVENAITALERLQASDPCRADVAHQLAILNHRHAIRLEENSRDGVRDRAWFRAFANWAIVLEDDAYWKDWIKGREVLYEMDTIDEKEVAQLRNEGVKSRVREIHSQYVQMYAAAGKQGETVRHRRLAAQWSLELSAARALHETIKMLSQRGRQILVKVPSGPLFWDQYNLRAQVSQMAEEALRLDRNFLPAYVLRDALAPTGLAKALLDETQIDEAVTLLEEQLRANPNDTSARQLIATALMRKLQAQATNDLEAALTTLERAKSFGANPSEAEEAIFSATMTRVSTLENAGRLDEADRVLRRVLRSLPSNRPLKDKLAEITCARVQESLNSGLKAMGEHPSLENVTALVEAGKRTLREVETVVGANHPRIQREMETLNGLTRQIGQAQAGQLNGEAVALAGRAVEDINRGYRTQGINSLLRAREMLQQAQRLDPYNATINQNIRDINDMLRRLGY